LDESVCFEGGLAERVDPAEHLGPLPLQVFGLRAGGHSGNGQWLVFVRLEVPGYGRVSEVVAPDELLGRLAKGQTPAQRLGVVRYRR